MVAPKSCGGEWGQLILGPDCKIEIRALHFISPQRRMSLNRFDLVVDDILNRSGRHTP